MEAVTAAVLSLVCCVFFCVLWNAACKNKNTSIFPVGSMKGRSLYKWLLPVFVFFLSLAAGFCRAQAVREDAETCQALELDGKWGSCTGTVERLVRRSERWEVVLRLQTMKVDGWSGGLSALPKRLLVYVKDQDAVHTCAETYVPGIRETNQTGVWKTNSSGIRETGKISGQKDMRLRVGLCITVKGRLQAFDKARNPGEFDFQDFYRAKKLFFRMSAEQCQWESESYDRIGDTMFRITDYAGKVLDEIADPKSAGIFRAAILGDRTGMDAGILYLYRRNGVAHLLAISGLHLSLISLAVYGGLRRTGFGFGAAGLIGGAVLVLYAGMTGMAPSIQRALVMALCGYLAAYLGRTYDLLSALSLAGILIFWDNPYALTQAGAQLSFAAVMGIGAEINQINQDGNFRQTLAVSMGIQLMTMPLVLYHFFEIPLYGMFLNLLVVPFMGIVIASGMAGILLGSWNIAAGRFAVGSGCGILVLYQWLCWLFALLPGANLAVGQPRPWQLGIYYGMMGACLFFRGPGFCRRKMRWSIALLAVVLLPLPLRGMQVTFLDVGQGDGICIRSASGVVLVDGGSSDEKKLGEDTLEPFLKSQGITKVDYAVVSHGDQDHINGLTELLQSDRGILIRHLVLPAAGYGDGIYSQLEDMANEHGAEVLWMGSGDCLNLGKLVIRCLYPDKPSLLDLYAESGGENQEYSERMPEAGKDSDRNEHSLVLQVSYGNFRMMLTGDMSADGEQAVMGNLELEKPVHVLKVAHHGSRFSTSSEWLDVLNPAWAVVSCGRNNRYGHPHEEVMDALQERGIVVWKTPEWGAVRLDTDGERIWWKPFLIAP